LPAIAVVDRADGKQGNTSLGGIESLFGADYEAAMTVSWMILLE
jgi:hypothetical protein